MMKLKRVSSPWLKLGITLSLILPQLSHAEPSYSGASAVTNAAADSSSINSILSSFSTATSSTGKSSIDSIKERLAAIKKTLNETAALAQQEDKNFKWQEDITKTDNLIQGVLAVQDSKAKNLVRSDQRAASLFSNFPRIQSAINSAMSAFSSSNLADSCTPNNGLDNVGQLARTFAPQLSRAADAMVLLFRDKGDRDAKAQKAQGLAIYQKLIKSLQDPSQPQLASTSALDVRTGAFNAAARGAAATKLGGELKQTLNSKNQELIELVFNPETGLFAKNVDDEQDRRDVAQNCLQAADNAEQNVNAQIQMVIQSEQALAANCERVERGEVADAQAGLTAIEQRDAGKDNALAAANQAYTNWNNEITSQPSCRNDQSGQLNQIWTAVQNVFPTWRQACQSGNSSDIAQVFGNFSTAYTTAFQQTSQLIDSSDSPKTACNTRADYRTSLRQQIQPLLALASQQNGVTTPNSNAIPASRRTSSSGSSGTHGFRQQRQN